MSAGDTGLFFLFRSFFKIGLTSFGGHAALVSVLQKELIEKHQVVEEEMLLNGMSIASFLPGPLAVNVVTYIGYLLRGWPGAMTAMFAVLLPPFLLMVGIARLYEVFATLDQVNQFLEGVLSVIIALVLAVCYRMFTRQVSQTWQMVLFGIVLILSFFWNDYYWIIIYIAAGGIIGMLIGWGQEDQQVSNAVHHKPGVGLWMGLGVVALGFVIAHFLLGSLFYQLLFEFAKISLTLFGGGYVMIPILHEIVVNDFQWLSSTEFANAIAFGQLTPGPILVSATYVGFKLGGIVGAVLATVGIFVPSAMLMVVIGSAFERVKRSAVVSSAMKGVYPSVIALIAYSAWVLFDASTQPVFTGIACLASFLLINYAKVNFFILILIAGVLGILIF